MINKVSLSMLKELIQAGALAFSGYSGFSGKQGPKGNDGSSGISGYSGYSGYSGISGYSGAADLFSTNVPVVLSDNKTFGRFRDGDTIPAAGKSAREVILLAVNEPPAPSVTVTSSSVVQFNQTAVNNILTFSYTINSTVPGTYIATTQFDWRRNNTGSWTTLSAGTYGSGNLVSGAHTYTDTSFNSQPFNYRLLVTDSQGASAVGYYNITPVTYVPLTVSVNVAAISSITSPETNTLREKGNIASAVSSLVVRGSPLVPLSGYTLQFRNFVNSWSAWTTLTAVPLTSFAATAPIGNYDHINNSLSASTNIAYRALVTDAYQDYLGTNVIGTNSVALDNLIFYGPASAVYTTSSQVRSLPNRGFMSVLSNPFNLNTGTTYNIFTAAMPSGDTITQVIDLDALNANITSNYILTTINVNDYIGAPVSYNVYTMTNAVVYSSSHRHQITRV